GDEYEDAAVLQQRRQGLRRSPIRLDAAGAAQRPAARKDEAAGSCHLSGDRGGSADQRGDVIGVNREKDERSGDGPGCREEQESRRPKAPRERAAKSSQPEAVDRHVTPIAVEEAIAEEGPDRRSLSAGKHTRQFGDPRRNEGEQEEYLLVDRRTEKILADDLDADEDRNHEDHDVGQIEDRLAIRLRGVNVQHGGGRLAPALSE